MFIFYPVTRTISSAMSAVSSRFLAATFIKRLFVWFVNVNCNFRYYFLPAVVFSSIVMYHYLYSNNIPSVTPIVSTTNAYSLNVCICIE